LESEKRSDSPRDTISLKLCRTSRPASTFGQEQAAALVTVAPKQKRSLNPNCKVKEQVSSNTIVRAAYMIKHRDIGFGKPSAPTLSNCVAPEHINRIVAPPHGSGRLVAGMALPDLSRSDKLEVGGTIPIRT
jgi:hypothetical protein